MRYQYYFCENYSQTLIEFLEKNNIKYKLTNMDTNDPIVSFSIWSNNANAYNLMQELEKNKVKVLHVYSNYSEEDRKNAKYLVIHPVKQNIEIVNASKSLEYYCTYPLIWEHNANQHIRQISALAIGKEPTAKSRTAFWTESAGCFAIFTDRRVYDMAKANSLTGIEFKNVLNRKGTVCENFFQLSSPHIIGKECIGKGYGERIMNCPVCKKEQFAIRDTYQLHLDFSKIAHESDLYITEPIFGDYKTYPKHLISQRFYQLLKQYNLAGGVNFKPVAEI